MRQLAVIALLLAALPCAHAAHAQEARLIAVLKSDASLKEKADACRDLARVGTRRAVPVLASLLADEKLSHMARYALEPIPDRSADGALRAALGRVKGRLLVGVICSLGVRKDANAIRPLARCLDDRDPAVAQAAGRALGSMGRAAVPILMKAVTTSSPANRLGVCEGLLRCAEAVPDTDAIAIYDRVRSLPKLPRHFRVAALRGAIERRGASGIPLLLQAIRTESYVPAADALRISTEIPGPGVTRALANEAARATPGKRLLLVKALGNRGDPTAASTLTLFARNGPSDLRIAAIHGLAQLGSSSSISLLVALLEDRDPNISDAARDGLIGFPGKKVDTAVAAMLNKPGVRIGIPMIEVARQRRMTAALPSLLRTAKGADAGVVDASCKALGELAGPAQIPAIVDAMLLSKNAAAAEPALLAVCARQPDPTLCAGQLLSGLAKAQGEPKLALLRLLGAVGGPEALSAVRASAADSDGSVRETALRALCDWPTSDALPELARVTKTTTDTKFRILALRGQLRLIPQQSVPDERKLSQLEGILPLIERKEEQTLALADLGGIASADSLKRVVPYLTDDSVHEEASAAAVAIAERIVANHPAEVRAAMILIETANSELAGRIRNVLARVAAGAVEAGFTSLFNGRDLAGWDGKPGWWKVEDGALTVESTPEKPCAACNYLIWRGGEPADFELLAEFKLSRSANSGIQIRSQQRPDWDTFGYQADMTGDGELVGFVYHHSRGLIAGRGERAVFASDGKKTLERIGDPAQLLKHFRQGGWNTYRVVCRGPVIELSVNGVLMCQVTDHHATEAASRGIIALQMHPGPPMKIQFRNIRLKVLK